MSLFLKKIQTKSKKDFMKVLRQLTKITHGQHIQHARKNTGRLRVKLTNRTRKIYR